MVHNKLDKFRQRIEESAFSKRGYSVTLDGARILSGLMFYGEGHAGINEQNTIERMTPAFQRDNDKWSEEQKIRFVENVIAGYKSTIILGTCNEMMDDCIIVDGLQRMTAINDYLNDKITAYGFLYSELLKEARPRLIFCRLHLTVTVLTFDSEREMVQFYIDINRGITHSNEDIKRAEDYLNGLTK